jgi:glycine hydroxymethyltransferase
MGGQVERNTHREGETLAAPVLEALGVATLSERAPDEHVEALKERRRVEAGAVPRLQEVAVAVVKFEQRLGGRALLQPSAYGVRESDHRIDLDQVRKLALESRPKLIWCGTTAYPRAVDFQGFRAIADEVGAILAADISHIAGLVAGGAHASPFGIADVVTTTTTHKTLRGPRGAAIFCKAEHTSTIDRAVFPGLQGGPHDHATAAIAVAAKPSFKEYAARIVANAKALGEALAERGFRLITGGTDNHLLLIDMTLKGVAGKPYAQALDKAGIVANYNSIPPDPRKPFDPSGIRLGAAAVSSRDMGAAEMKELAGWMDDVVGHIGDEARLAHVAAEVKALCARFPAPGLRV